MARSSFGVAATQNRQTNGGTVVNSRQATSGGVELVWNCEPLLGGSVTMPRAPLAAIGAICCQTHGIRSNATFHPLLLLLHSYKDKSTHTMCAVSFDNAECCFVSTSAIGNPLQSTGIGESHQCGIQSCCYLINYVEYPGTHVLKCNVRAAGWHNVSHIDHLAASPGEPPSVPLSPRDCTFVHLRYEPIVPPRCLIHQPLTTTLFLLQLSPDAILASV